MKKYYGVGVVISLMLCCELMLSSDMCFAVDNNNDQLVQTLMQKSGMKKQIEQIPQLLQAELERQKMEAKGISPEEFNRFSNIMRSAFDAKTIETSVQTYIKQNLSEYDTKKVLEWLDSPLGKKITKLEEDASTAEASMDMQVNGPKLLEENKDTARMNKIERLDKAIGVTQSTVNTILNIQLAMMTAISAAMEADKRPTFGDVQDIVKKSQPQIQAAMKQIIQIQFLYTYRVLTDYEIDKYTQFATSIPGQRYHSVSIKAIDEALVQAARKIGSIIGMRMNKI